MVSLLFVPFFWSVRTRLRLFWGKPLSAIWEGIVDLHARADRPLREWRHPRHQKVKGDCDCVDDVVWQPPGEGGGMF